MRYPLCVLLACAAAGPGQSYVTSPPGLLTETDFVPTPFVPESGRRMHLDGEWRGTVMVLKEVAYRPLLNPLPLMGRSWTNVTVDVSDCNFSAATTVFANNPTSTPVQVFNGPVAWPDETITIPVWGGQSGATRFPFSRPWVYTGAQDICLDFNFTGGRLRNGGSWSNPLSAFPFDGFFTGTKRLAFGNWHGDLGPNKGCIDSRSVNGYGAYAQLVLTTYARGATPSEAVVADAMISDAGPGAVVAHLVGFGGLTPGIPFPGVSCNSLFIDVNQPNVLLMSRLPPAVTTDVVPLGTVPYSAAFGVRLWYQAAWMDTGIPGRLLLSSAHDATPARIPHVVKRIAIEESPNLPSRFAALVPAVRYTR